MVNSEKSLALNVFLIKSDFVKDEDIICKQLNLLEKKEVKIGDSYIGGLYLNPIKERRPAWIDLFSSANIPGLDDIKTKNVSAVLLVPHERRIFAIVFGYGRHLLNLSAIEERFGLITTLNSIAPNSIRSIDRKVVDSLSRQVREQVNRETELRYFGLDVEQDLLRAVTGKSFVEVLGTRLSGKDNLTASVKMNLKELKPFFSTAYTQYKKTDYKREFSWIDNIKELKDPIIKNKLNEILIKEIKKGHQTDKLWLAVPEIIDWARVAGFSFSESKKMDIRNDLHIKDFIGTLKNLDQLTINTLNSRRAYFIDLETEMPMLKWPVYRCICFETEMNGDTYILNEGKWYRINPSFVSAVDNYIGEIHRSNLELPEYSHKSEEDYNRAITSTNPSKLALMDKKLIRYGGGSSSLEFCDVFSKDGHLLHVKKYGGSSVLSHLFAQGAVSAEVFLMDADFRRELNKKLPKTHIYQNPKEQPDPSKYEIAFGVISRSRKELKLPFFSRVNFRNTTRRLKGYGYKVTLTKILVNN